MHQPRPGSGVDPVSLLAIVDGRARAIRYDPRRGLAQVALGRLTHGRHTLVFSAGDWQETKNNEDGARTLPNTRRLTTAFAVR